MDEITGTLLLVLILLILYAVRDANYKPKGYPPGPFLLPLVGYVPLTNINNPFDSVHTLAKHYGEALSLRLGILNIVILNSWDLVKEAFNNANLEGRPVFNKGQVSTNGRILGLVSTQGTYWQQQKKHFNQYLHDITLRKLSIESTVLREVEKMKDDLYEKAGQPISIKSSIKVSITNILWKIFAGLEVDVKDPSMVNIMDVLNNSITFAIDDLYPWFVRLIPGFVFVQRVKEELLVFSNKLLEDHKASYDPSTMRDFIDSFLKHMKEDEDNNLETSSFTDVQLTHILLEFFFAGSETITSAMNFTFLLLILNQDVQQRLQQDVLELTKGKRDVTLNDKSALPYVEAFIMELQRTCNIVPFTLPHVATNDANIGKYTIPKGTLVVTYSKYIHLDPHNWPEPEKFDPKRFLNQDGSVKRMVNAFLPFSIGKRTCVGKNLANSVMFLFVANMVQKFTFSSPTGVTTPSPFQTKGMVLFNPLPYELVATPNKEDMELPNESF